MTNMMVNILFWVMIEFYDFGDMSRLFSQLTTDLQKNYCQRFKSKLL